MKRLLILTAVTLTAAAGCRHCGLCGGGGAATSVYRPPSCAPTCGSGQAYPAVPAGAYAAPGTTFTPDVMAAPTTTVVPGTGPAYPGPEVYTPAN